MDSAPTAQKLVVRNFFLLKLPSPAAIEKSALLSPIVLSNHLCSSWDSISAVGSISNLNPLLAMAFSYNEFNIISQVLI